MPTFSAARGDSSFTDAHGVEIVYSTWRAGKPKGIVQIAHGVGEHALRYEPLAQDLVRAGQGVQRPEATATLAYRWQPAGRGGFYKIGFTPTLRRDEIVPLFGVSAGVTF